MRHSILLKSVILIVCIVIGMLVFTYLKSIDLSDAPPAHTVGFAGKDTY